MSTFNIGDVVIGLSHNSKLNELTTQDKGVIVDASRSGYSVYWEKRGNEAWFSDDELELLHACPIQVKVKR